MLDGGDSFAGILYDRPRDPGPKPKEGLVPSEIQRVPYNQPPFWMLGIGVAFVCLVSNNVWGLRIGLAVLVGLLAVFQKWEKDVLKDLRDTWEVQLELAKGHVNYHQAFGEKCRINGEIDRKKLEHQEKLVDIEHRRGEAFKDLAENRGDQLDLLKETLQAKDSELALLRVVLDRMRTPTPSPVDDEDGDLLA